MSTQWSRRLFTVVRRLVAWSRRPKVQRILAGTVVLLTGGFLFGALAAGWVQVRPHVAELDWRFALLGQVFAVAAYLLGSVVWYCVQRSFGIASSLRRSMVIHVTSSATKYIPGYGWHYMSKAYMSRETQARPRTLAGAMATEVGILLGVGALIAALLAVILGQEWALDWNLPRWLWMLIGWGALALIVGLIVFLPKVVQLSSERAERSHALFGATDPAAVEITTSPETPSGLAPDRPSPMGLHTRVAVSRWWMAATIVVAVLGWLLYAVSTWYFARALYPIPVDGLWQCLFALTVGGVVSLLVIFVPVGLGVREATMSVLLVGLLPLGLAVVVSILTRVSVILSEAVGFMIAIRRQRPLPGEKDVNTPNGLVKEIPRNRD